MTVIYKRNLIIIHMGTIMIIISMHYSFLIDMIINLEIFIYLNVEILAHIFFRLYSVIAILIITFKILLTIAIHFPRKLS